MTHKELKKLKLKLPTNYLDIVKEEFAVSSQYINYILTGKRNNQDILNKLVEIAENYKKEQEELSSKIASL